MASSLASSSSSLKPLVSSEVPISKDLFLSHHKGVVFDEFMSAHSLAFPKVLAELIVQYVISKEDCFGAQKWLGYCEVDIVDPEPLLDPYKFYRYWFGADPIDPSKKVCDTHLPPILRPRVVTHITEAWSTYFGLNVLGHLIQNPKKGHPSRYCSYHTAALKQHRTDKAERACWIVMREDKFSRDQSYDHQKQSIKDINQATQAGYEEESSLIDLATVVSVRYADTGERHLGDPTGVEKCWTYARAKEKVKYEQNSCQAVVGGFSSPSVVGGVAPHGLVIDCDVYVARQVVVANLRKFY